ncbi:MAG TPA: energy transducer TonB [Polyangiaceae bacterium]|nr:energy transducer TonB [Polyangiaceae bacterium]
MHAFLVAFGAALWSARSGKAPEPGPREVSIDVANEGVGPNPNPSRASALASSAVEEVRPPGGSRVARPDVGKTGRGGTRDGAPATNLASSVDPLTLERDPPNHLARSEVQRLRTGGDRRSLDDRRATPNPMELSFVASGRGRLALRRPDAPQVPAKGERIGGVAAVDGAQHPLQFGDDSRPVAEREGAEARRALGAIHGEVEPRPRASASVLLARPWVPKSRAAVPALKRDQPSDTVESEQLASSPTRALQQASTLGGEANRGVGGEPVAAFPALGSGDQWGSASAPSGAGNGPPDFASDPSLQGFYRGVLSHLQRVLDRTFPDWAIAQGRGGLVVFDLTLTDAGRVASVSVIRPSGIEEYDRNVVLAVRRVPGFGPVPPALGTRAVLRISWDSRNPAVGRNGPGPGRAD